MGTTKFFVRPLPPKMQISLCGLFDEQGDGYGRYTTRSLENQVLALQESFRQAGRAVEIVDERVPNAPLV